ncbi:DedA family protein [Tengunoibacter tsumagoiensis]|uniref:Alkaline phosphatase n=1 Tax=Tengunoibacter tsumagoiensis TaxID=2014871 RepID=A0A401ZTS6_9CHLR|nr:DedA family protein [Tengunoibacter tsumagoiensis]GCE10271.1 alkaline phosphatase [Tengunoibacter tsumagoiensis]
MNILLPWLLNWLQLYGYPALWMTIFVAAIGLPLPISLVLLAAGAFSALGDFNFPLLIVIALSALIAGDSVGYLLGYRFGRVVLNWLGEKKRFGLFSPQVIRRSQDYFQRSGGIAVFLSRFLVPALGGSINLLAGAESYPYRRFLIYDTCGECISALLPLSLGFVFGESWEAIGDLLTTISGFALLTSITFYLAFQLYKLVIGARRRRATEAGRQRESRNLTRLKGKKEAPTEMLQKRLDSLPL